MRKFLLCLFLFISVYAFSLTSGTLVLQGTVPGILEITVNSSANATALDLTANVTDILVASIVERSNKKAGYTVIVESQNAVTLGQPSFKSTDSTNSDTLTYTLTYGTTPVTFVAGQALISDVNTKTGGSGTAKDVKISYTGASQFLFEDSYKDQLTFTITAK